MLKRKKGSIQDVLYIGVTLLTLAFLMLIGFVIMSQLNDNFSTNQDLDSIGRNASLQLTSYYPGLFDNMFLVIAVGMAIGAIVLAALVRVHPIFIVFFLILLVLMIVFSAIFSNIYQGAAENPTLLPYADQLIFTSLILEFLPLIVGIFGFLIMIVMYKVGQDG